MPAERTLFRPEALDAQRQSWLGGVQLVRPLSLSWLTLGAVAAVVAVAAFLALGSYTRKATVNGVVVPDRGVNRLVPSVPGTVLERRVNEGQAVQAGDVLFVLALDRPLLAANAQAQVQRSLDDRRRSLAEASRTQQQLTASRRLALDRRLAAMDAEQAQMDTEAALQQQRLTLAEQGLARLQALQNDQFISAAQTQVKSEEVLGLRAAAQALARQRAALQRERAELEGDKQALPLTASSVVSGLERDLAQANRDAAEQDAEQRLVVRAPQAGTISTVLAEPGQSVSPASALATLLPQGALMQVQLYAPSSAVGFVQVGQPVRLRYEAFPYQKYGQQPGRVVQVSRTPLASGELAALSLSAGPLSTAASAGVEPLFRITVALEPPPAGISLVAGMRLQADVWLERRRLIEWLFEPLLGLHGRL
jgi:membrane fusion protein